MKTDGASARSAPDGEHRKCGLPAGRPDRRPRLVAYGLAVGSVMALAALSLASWWSSGAARGTAQPDAALVSLSGHPADQSWSGGRPATWRDIADEVAVLSGDGIVAAGLTLRRVGDGTTGHEWGRLQAQGPEGALVWSSPKHPLALTTPYWSDGERVYTMWTRSERRSDLFLAGTTDTVVERLLVTIDVHSGRELWWTRLDPTSDTTVVLGADALLLVSSDGYVHQPQEVFGLDGPTGAVLWRATPPQTSLGASWSVTVVGDAVQLRWTGQDLVTQQDLTRYAIVDLRSGGDRTSA